MQLTKEVEKEFIDALNRSRKLQGEERTMKSLNSYFEGECCGFRVYKKRINKKDRTGKNNLEEYMK